MFQRIAMILAAVMVLGIALTPFASVSLAESSQAESGNVLITGPLQMKDIDGHWAEEMIDKMMAKTIAFGFLDQTFRPDQAMSRLDVAIMLVKGLGLETWLTAQDSLDYLLPFSDVSDLTREQRKYVYIVSGLGLMIGDTAQTFRPFDAITRDEFATLLVRALGYERETKSETVEQTQLPFADNGSIPDWALNYVRVAWSQELIIGYENNNTLTFRPKREITRAEVTTVISRIDAMTASGADLRQRNGNLAEVDADARQIIVVSAEGERYVMAVDEEASIYVGGEPAGLADIQQGTEADIVVDGNGQVIYLSAFQPKDGETQLLHMLKGSVTLNGWQQNTNEAAQSASIQLQAPGDQTVDIIVNGSTPVYIGSQLSTPSDIEIGAKVSVIATLNSSGDYVASEIRVFAASR